MTHDELLKDIKDNADYGYIPGQPDPIAAALIAVVELHKPFSTKGFEDDPICQACSGLDARDYPCLTIQAIEKELL